MGRREVPRTLEKEPSLRMLTAEAERAREEGLAAAEDSPALSGVLPRVV